MKFYSDKTKKIYDTLELCEAAEKEFDKQKCNIEDEYEHAYAELCEASKNYSNVMVQSEEEIAKVLKEAKEKIKEARIQLDKAQEKCNKFAAAYTVKAVDKDSNGYDDELPDQIDLFSSFFF